jgi:molybdenum-dependent DNA-binding transcriptional regulator ModE
MRKPRAHRRCIMTRVAPSTSTIEAAAEPAVDQEQGGGGGGGGGGAGFGNKQQVMRLYARTNTQTHTATHTNRHTQIHEHTRIHKQKQYCEVLTMQ